MNVDQLAAQVKRLTREKFVEEHPHLFFLFGDGGSETSPMQFFTEAPPHPPSAWTFTGVLQLVPITKAENSPYPDRISIGRARNCDVVLRHPSVSKLHAHVRKEADGRWMLHDAGSHNGTSVGTLPVTTEPAELHSGDLVTFGAFTVRVVDSAEVYVVLTRMVQASARR